MGIMCFIVNWNKGNIMEASTEHNPSPREVISSAIESLETLDGWLLRRGHGGLMPAELRTLWNLKVLLEKGRISGDIVGFSIISE